MSMTQSSDPKVEMQLLLQRIHELATANPEAADEIAQASDAIPAAKNVRSLLMRNREKLSYYNEEWAKALQPTLDKLIETKIPQHFYLKDFPNTAKRTLYLRIYNSWLWLRDNKDPDGKYQKLWDETEVDNSHASGVRIQWKNVATPSLPSTDVNVALDTISKLQNKITAFLEMALERDSMFDEKGLSLTAEQIAAIEAGLPPISPPKFNWIIEPTRVRIMRLV